MMLTLDKACPDRNAVRMTSMDSLAWRVGDVNILKYMNVSEIEFKSLRNVKNMKEGDAY